MIPLKVNLVKRVFDISLSLFVLICLSPFFLIVAVLIKRGSKGPVIYSQRRVQGLYPANIDLNASTIRCFNIYKFRTMIQDAEQNGAINAVENDPRVTKIGKFLRATRLDELPNFFNVLIGHMSVVGPRADRPEMYKEAESITPGVYEITRYVKPGITGLAQIKLQSDGTFGKNSGLEKCLPEYEEHGEKLDNFRYKLYYATSYLAHLRNIQSYLYMELKIILMTPYIMFVRRNVI